MQFDVSDYQASLGNQEFGSNIQYIKETHSTNDEIWNHKITSNPLIIITDSQTKGRGRRSNNWFSKKYESLLFSIGIIDQKPKLISQKISIAIADAIINQTQLNPKIKKASAPQEHLAIWLIIKKILNHLLLCIQLDVQKN